MGTSTMSSTTKIAALYLSLLPQFIDPAKGSLPALPHARRHPNRHRCPRQRADRRLGRFHRPSACRPSALAGLALRMATKARR